MVVGLFFYIIIVAKVLGGFVMEFFWDGEFMAMGCGNWFC